MPRISKYLIRLKQVACCATVLLCLFYSKAYALGLGKLEVQSNLDEALRLKIELIANGDDDLKGVKAVIASREDFAKIGAFYPEYLKTVSIQMVNEGISPHLLMTSKQIIKEPFIHFLVRVNWSGGSLLREYTALIDPPVYASEAPQPIVTPKVVSSDSESESLPYEEDDYQQVDESLSDDNVSELQQSSEPVYDPGISNLDDVDAAYGPVESGETLSEIAAGLQQQFPELSMYQIMYVLFQENRSAFIDDNINGLLKGAVLKISSISKIKNTAMSDATGLFTEHVAKWQARTGYIASEQPQELKVSQEEDAVLFDDDQVAEVEEEETVSDDSVEEEVAIEDSETEVTKPVDDADNFVIGSSDDTQTGSSGVSNEGEVLALENEISELNASLESSELEKSELQERVSILEAQLEEVNRLMAMEVEDAELASLQDSQNVDETEEVTDEMQKVSDEMEEVVEGESDQYEEVGDELVEVADESAVEVENADELKEVDETQGEKPVGNEEVSAQGNQTEEAKSRVTPVEPQPTPTQKKVTDVSRTPADFKQPQSFVDKIFSSVSTMVDAVKKPFKNLGLGAVLDGGNNLAPMLGGFGVLLLSILGLVVYRNKKALEEFEISMMSIGSDSQISSRSANVAAAGNASSSLESSFLTVYSESKGVVHADEIDPVAEADVYIAYGRDEQAEDVLKEGIQKHPDRADIKLKLLKLYKRNKDATKFERLAEELYPTEGEDDKVWQKVVSMGKTLSPNNPLFASDIEGMENVTAEEPAADIAETADEDADFTKTAVLKTAVLPKAEDEEDQDISVSDTIAVDNDADDDAFLEDEIAEQDDNVIDLTEDADETQINDTVEAEIDEIDLGDNEIAFDTDDLVMDDATDTQSINSNDTQSINTSDTQSINTNDTQSINTGDTQSIDAEITAGADTQSIDTSENTGSTIDMPETANTASPAATLELNLEEVNLEFEDDQDEQSDIEINVVDEDEDIDLNLQSSETDDDAFKELTIEVENEDDASTQIELAKVFVDLGDVDGAKKILNDIIEADGNEEQKADAEALLASIK